MRNVAWPTAGKIRSWRLSIAAHTRGAASREGAGTWSRGSGAYFTGELSTAPMTPANALTFRAFLHSLRGRSGSFLLTVPGTESLAAGTATTSGALAADASSMTLTGASPTSELVAGAYLTIGDMTVDGQLVQAVSVSGSTVEFRPRLRAAWASGTAVTFGQVEAAFCLAEKTPIVAVRAEGCPGVSLAFEECR